MGDLKPPGRVWCAGIGEVENDCFREKLTFSFPWSDGFPHRRSGLRGQRELDSVSGFPTDWLCHLGQDT